MSKLLTLLFLLVGITNAFHFYVDTDETKCFYEELPKDTIAVGKYEVYELNLNTREYEKVNNLKVELTVEELFHNNHKVVNQKNEPIGQLTFTSLDTGEHRFCLTPRHTDWSKRARHRVFFDLAIGDAKSYVDSKKSSEFNELTARINELSKKLQHIRVEQDLFREREMIFRDQSESTNSRAVKWTLFQVAVLVATGVWQLSYLKGFFVKQKVV
ncbi:BA75_02602T0 [Komagataella pastoris]|uniref:BA75_02602T0 n=1 Tax=Komagataella pastoris TaxID=4922 RepID=A0A1B2JBL9_PICPA|nr:BA75_02602T0 [Komagataella pastoris]